MTESSDSDARLESKLKADLTPHSAEKLEMAIRAVQQGLKAIELVYSSHPRWPLPQQALPKRPRLSGDVSTKSGKLLPVAASIMHGRSVSLVSDSFCQLY